MKNKILFIFIAIYIIGCAGGGGSMEFTSAKTAARTERNLQKAEEWGLKALNVESDSNNALVPYFLAVDVYRPQKKWIKMAEMFDEALRRNPSQKLDKPKILIDPEKITKENRKESIAYTVEEGIEAYRKQEWAIVFNLAVESIQNDKLDQALDYLSIAKTIDPMVDANYEVMAEIYISKEDFEQALTIANDGISLFPDSGGLYSIIGRVSYDSGDLENAEKMLNKALALSDKESSSPLMKILSYVYIDLGKTEEAINLSKNLLDTNPDDPLLYYNLAVVYQRLVSDSLDKLTIEFNDLMSAENTNKSKAESMIDAFNKLKKQVKSSRENFLLSSDLSIDDNSAKESMEAAREMRKLLMQIDDIYLPALKEKRN
tara:strand:+ start:304 stop:1425 length:1122 start_codon:yes stop_codon:yes gene_type:complete